MSVLEETTRTGRVRRDHLLAVALALTGYLLVLVGQYATLREALDVGVSNSNSLIGFWISIYGEGLGLLLGFLGSFAIFLVISTVITWWALRSSRNLSSLQHSIASGLFIIYVGYMMAVAFLSSLEWTSSIANRNLEVSQILQRLYLFNLGAALCYLGLVLLLRRAHGSLSAPETDHWI